MNRIASHLAGSDVKCR